MMPDYLPVVVWFCGPRCCGTSTLSRILFHLLAHPPSSPRLVAEGRPVWISSEYDASWRSSLHTARTHPAGGGDGQRAGFVLLDVNDLHAEQPQQQQHRQRNNKRRGGAASSTQDVRASISLILHAHHPDGETALVERLLPWMAEHDERYPPTTKLRRELITTTSSAPLAHSQQTHGSSPAVAMLDLRQELPQRTREMWRAVQQHVLDASAFSPVVARAVQRELSDEEVAAAIVMATHFDTLAAPYRLASSSSASPTPLPFYSCLALDEEEVRRKVVAQLSDDVCRGQIIQSEFHVTTKFFGHHLHDPTAITRTLVEMQHTGSDEIYIAIVAAYADADGVALTVAHLNNPVAHEAWLAAVAQDAELNTMKVRDDFWCTNVVPHITVANRHGVSPVYSNELCSNTNYPPHKTRRVMAMNPPIILRATLEIR